MAFCILNAVKNSHENTKDPKIQHITMFAFIPLGKKNGFTKKGEGEKYSSFFVKKVYDKVKSDRGSRRERQAEQSNGECDQ